MQIRAVSIKYAKQLKKAKQKRTEKTLETEILMLERKLEYNLSEIEKREIRTKLEIKKQILEQWIIYKTQGSIIRSRTPSNKFNRREHKALLLFLLCE